MMNDDIVVLVENASKAYSVYSRPMDRLKQAILRSRRIYYEEFWALKDVSFTLRRGETLGVIGVNGSGKSTLLQIIAGTLSPNQGRVRVRGRLGALLELGSGFNPNFTGRENVFLNGAVLGLSREEIDRRFDEITEFADIGDFINQPIKTYSTGMVVRLAFAVQVLIEPDLLIIDEALAVGDASFQFKCLSRMKQLVEKGVAVILVSHSVDQVRAFCERVIWLDKGKVRDEGSPLEVTSKYVQFLFGEEVREVPSVQVHKTPEDDPGSGIKRESSHPKGDGETRRVLIDPASRRDLIRWGSGELIVEGFAFDQGRPMNEPVFRHGDSFYLEVVLRAVQDLSSETLSFGFALRNEKGLDAIVFTTYETGCRFPNLSAGDTIRLAFEFKNILAPGNYALVLATEEVTGPGSKRKYLDYIENAVVFHVLSDFDIFSVVLPEIRQLVFETKVKV